jgi:hypothetical protein
MAIIGCRRGRRTRVGVRCGQEPTRTNPSPGSSVRVRVPRASRGTHVRGCVRRGGSVRSCQAPSQATSQADAQPASSTVCPWDWDSRAAPRVPGVHGLGGVSGVRPRPTWATHLLAAAVPVVPVRAAEPRTVHVQGIPGTSAPQHTGGHDTTRAVHDVRAAEQHWVGPRSVVARPVGQQRPEGRHAVGQVNDAHALGEPGHFNVGILRQQHGWIQYSTGLGPTLVGATRGLQQLKADALERQRETWRGWRKG